MAAVDGTAGLLVQQLTAKGIGVDLRHSAPPTSAGLASASPEAAHAHRR
ncbi:hypothetical protein ACIA8E_12700 [Streptomyces sp. NPDC051664]